MTDKLKTASAHNSPLTGRVEMEEPSILKTALALESRVAALESSLSRAQERLGESVQLLENAADGLHEAWQYLDGHIQYDTLKAEGIIRDGIKKLRLATEDAKPKETPQTNDDPVKPADYKLLEATMRLIAEPWRQNDYTPQQLARHVLRIEPLRDTEDAKPSPEREEKPTKPEKERG